MMRITFAKFKRPSTGDDCEGADFMDVGGNVRGYIQRDIRWKDSIYRSCGDGFVVDGYYVNFYGTLASDEEPLFETLAAARAFVREKIGSSVEKIDLQKRKG